MKTPEEIKKGLKICGDDKCSNYCPYYDNCFMKDAFCELASDALAYIQQLEAALTEPKNDSMECIVEEELW